jgi:hypothetical protein
MHLPGELFRRAGEADVAGAERNKDSIAPKAQTRRMPGKVPVALSALPRSIRTLNGRF